MRCGWQVRASLPAAPCHSCRVRSCGGRNGLGQTGHDSCNFGDGVPTPWAFIFGPPAPIAPAGFFFAAAPRSGVVHRGEEQSAGDDEDGGEGEEEEEEEDVQPIGKRKRTSQQSVFLRPTKKVAFAAEPKGTKQSRSTAGARGALAARGKEAKIKPQSGKPPVKAKVTKATPAKVANTVSSKTPVKTTSNGEETYDFKKFF